MAKVQLWHSFTDCINAIDRVYAHRATHPDSGFAMRARQLEAMRAWCDNADEDRLLKYTPDLMTLLAGLHDNVRRIEVSLVAHPRSAWSFAKPPGGREYPI